MLQLYIQAELEHQAPMMQHSANAVCRLPELGVRLQLHSYIIYTTSLCNASTFAGHAMTLGIYLH